MGKRGGEHEGTGWLRWGSTEKESTERDILTDRVIREQ